MRGFVETQALDVRPIECLEKAALPRHLARPFQRLEGDELGAGLRLGTLDHVGERKADPGDDHRPALDAAMAINALLEREGLDKIFERIIGRLGDEAVDPQAPGLCGELMGLLLRIVLIGAELVIVVVARHISECRRHFIG